MNWWDILAWIVIGVVVICVVWTIILTVRDSKAEPLRNMPEDDLIGLGIGAIHNQFAGMPVYLSRTMRPGAIVRTGPNGLWGQWGAGSETLWDYPGNSLIMHPSTWERIKAVADQQTLKCAEGTHLSAHQQTRDELAADDLAWALRQIDNIRASNPGKDKP